MTQFATTAPSPRSLALPRRNRRTAATAVDLRCRQADAAIRQEAAIGSAAAVEAAAPASTVYPVGLYVLVWLLEGIALGTIAGLAVSGLVIALVLALRQLLIGA